MRQNGGRPPGLLSWPGDDAGELDGPQQDQVRRADDEVVAQLAIDVLLRGPLTVVACEP
jgi:hypothetical protein